MKIVQPLWSEVRLIMFLVNFFVFIYIMFIKNKDKCSLPKWIFIGIFVWLHIHVSCSLAKLAVLLSQNVLEK